MDEQTYRALERQIALIHELLESSDAEVTWNDRIPDPDNPKQLRQIDVSIRRGNRLTLVECRAWHAPQDVNWIEHLDGRRRSMNADAVIGVSSSGFTETAILKAERLGVILRDFETLSPEEIRAWGTLSTQFRDVEVTITMPNAYRESDGLKITTPDGEPIAPRTVLTAIAEKLATVSNQAEFVDFHTAMTVEQQRVNGVQPIAIKIRGRMRTRHKTSALPSVAIYGKAGDARNSMEAHVERFNVGNSQIISGPKLSSIVFDLSQVKIPDNCIFGIPVFSNSEGLAIRDAKLLGIGNVLQSRVSFKYVLQWSQD